MRIFILIEAQEKFYHRHICMDGGLFIWQQRWNCLPLCSALGGYPVTMNTEFCVLMLKRAVDNIMIERLWRTVKYEEIYLKEYKNVSELKAALKKYFHFCNFGRLHKSLGGKSQGDIYLAAKELSPTAQC